MRRFSVFLLLLALAVIPVRGADWLMHSGNPQRTGWQKDETKISKDSVKNLKLSAASSSTPNSARSTRTAR